MSARSLSLAITTPLAVLAEVEGVTSFRASDDSGSFGVMPGHADILSVLRDCVARWRTGKGQAMEPTPPADLPGPVAQG